jgi:hypothetical protein
MIQRIFSGVVLRGECGVVHDLLICEILKPFSARGSQLHAGLPFLSEHRSLRAHTNCQIGALRQFRCYYPVNLKMHTLLKSAACVSPADHHRGRHGVQDRGVEEKRSKGRGEGEVT